MANITLLEEVVGFITEHPERHDQGTWAKHIIGDDEEVAPSAQRNWCGTTACLAGWTVLLQGYAADWAGCRQWEAGATCVKVEEGDAVYDVEIADQAQRLLDLTDEQRSFLFHEDRTLDEIQRAVDALRDNPEVDPYDVPGLIRDEDEDRY